MNNTVFLLFLAIHLCAFGQLQEKVNFTHAEAFIQPIPAKKQINGRVTYTFEILENVDSVYLDARDMKFTSILLNNTKATSFNDQKSVSIKKKFRKGKLYELMLEYEARPKQAVYFINWDNNISDNKQIWTQGQGKYTSNWLPSFDDMNEKVEFDLTITADSVYKIIANGKLKNIVAIDGQKSWLFDMDKPMSSYLLAFAVGDYRNETLVSESGVPIELYYYSKDSLRVEPTYRYTKQIFDFLEKEIGVPYPWQNYKQVPVRDFLYAGMENTGTTLFSDGYVIDSTAFVDKNYVNVNAHELAHQWFGNLVTEKNGNHHWLHEGFATYYAYLVEKEVFGEEYFYWKLYDTAKALEQLSREGKGEALTNPGASSLTFYEKGAWALHMLRMKVGEGAFKKGIKTYLEKFQFKNAVIKDFIDIMQQVSGTDLPDFEKLWLSGTEFPFEVAREYLIQSSKSLRTFFELQRELTTSKVASEKIIKRYWDNSESIYLKKNSISKYHKSFPAYLLKEVFGSGDIQLRQALAIALKNIPTGMESEFESLLTDSSYVTIENALYTLWVQNPDHRARYLDTTKDVTGLPNKNVRLLWLLLATLTKDYEQQPIREKYLRELLTYTSPEYPFEIRQNAFALITGVFTLPDENLRDLVNASVHHSWQFRKYARDLLGKIMENKKEKERLMRLTEELKGEELRYIKSKLESE